MTIPGLLARFTDGDRAVAVEAATVAECVDRLLASYPDLEPHLFDGEGGLRPHLQLFHNGDLVKESEGAGVALAAGDEVLVLQAVSGG